MSDESFVTMQLDPDRLVAGFEGFVDALDVQLPVALKMASGFVSTRAKTDHPYHDRTGLLTNSIRPMDPTGKFSEGTLGVDVIAGGLFNVEYAAYVELGTKDSRGRRRNKPYPFMGPALDHELPRAVKVIGDAIDAAIKESGL